MGAKALELVLLWHMHQPDYRDYVTGEFRLPWVYLHATKDYTDMAAHLERHPGMRAVVNFTPVLLEQIEDYADQFATGNLRDPLLRLLARGEDTPLTAEERRFALSRCFEANPKHMIHPFPAYKVLQDACKLLSDRGEDDLPYLSDAYFYDLVTWFHLAWTGETVRRSSEIVAQLMSKGDGFTRADRSQLFRVLGELVGGVIGRYAKLAQSGQVELSTTPDHHPLAPLLINLSSAREAMPAAELPRSREYPGGTARVIDHAREAIASHARRFGAPPVGMWPAEGAVSAPLLALLEGQGCRWCASGETVLMNSLPHNGKAADAATHLHRPFRLAGSSPGPAIFFRSDRLSDLIGFEYAKWNGSDAASNFVSQLEGIVRDMDGERIVSVILDGENCWEYYDYNGYYFLEALYKRLESHASIRTTTYRDYLAKPDLKPAYLERLTAGSWVFGNFSTWIGSPDKNRAWDLLCGAKQSFDLVIASGRLDEEQKRAVCRQLAACEASDWFWWLGDYNPQGAVQSFDALFRGNLTNLYRLLHLPAPASLTQAISHGSGNPEAGGTMRRSGEVLPSG